jgi:hypothetical protein
VVNTSGILVASEYLTFKSHERGSYIAFLAGMAQRYRHQEVFFISTLFYDVYFPLIMRGCVIPGSDGQKRPSLVQGAVSHALAPRQQEGELHE